MTYALAGAAANLATQGVAMGAGEQSKLNGRSLATQTVASGVSGGVLKSFGVDPSRAAESQYMLGDIAMNMASSEAVNAAQQMFLMSAGLQSKPDWTGFAAVGFNAVAGAGVQAAFGDTTLSSGIYTGVTMAANRAMRGQAVDVSVLSANMVGAMIGSYAGHEGYKLLQSQELKHASEQAIKRQQAPRALAATNTQPISAMKPTHQVARTAAKPVPQSASAQAKGLAVQESPDDNWVVDEYRRTRGYGYAHNQSAFFSNANRARESRPSNLIGMLRESSQSQPATELSSMELNIVRDVAIGALGVSAAVIFMPEAIGAMALAGLGAAGAVDLAAMGMLPEMMGAVEGAAGVAVRGVVGGVLARTGLRVVRDGEEGVMQAATKHPLTGLSPRNVVRLADEIGLGTSRDQLILWSGIGKDNMGVTLSQEFARANGGLTLEMTQGGKWLDKMDLFGVNSPFSKNEALQIWDNVSTKMIQQASGQVRAVIGQVRPESIYRAEQAEIFMNNKITGLDELNLKPRYVFDK